jgi:hypothetical protein
MRYRVLEVEKWFLGVHCLSVFRLKSANSKGLNAHFGYSWYIAKIITYHHLYPAPCVYLGAIENCRGTPLYRSKSKP